MAWISSNTVLMRHRKLIELARELRLKPVYLLGHLHALWHNALEQAEDGDLSQWSDEFIAESACYSGDSPQFVSLLQKHKWLDGKIIHDWLDYVGKYLTIKYKENNKSRLEEIWAKHGKSYGEKESKSQLPKGSGKEVERKQKGNLDDILFDDILFDAIPDKDNFPDFEKSVVKSWNSFCDKFPIVPKITAMPDSRRKKLKSRFAQQTFKNFQAILDKIQKQKFLLGEGNDKWVLSFDWLIENDKNHLKILEDFYRDKKQEREVDTNAY